MMQVDRLHRALILLGLALSSERLCVFTLHDAVYILNFFVTFFTLSFSELSLVRLALDLVDWPLVLWCHDVVGWVIWLVKLSPKCPVICHLGSRTLLYWTMLLYVLLVVITSAINCLERLVSKISLITGMCWVKCLMLLTRVLLIILVWGPGLQQSLQCQVIVGKVASVYGL